MSPIPRSHCIYCKKKRYTKFMIKLPVLRPNINTLHSFCCKELVCVGKLRKELSSRRTILIDEIETIERINDLLSHSSTKIKANEQTKS